MKNIIVEKYFGFRECERYLEDRAKNGWVLCGFTYTCSLKDVFVVTYKKGRPENARFMINKYVENNLNTIELVLNQDVDDSWELVSSSWHVASLVLVNKDILVAVYKQRL